MSAAYDSCVGKDLFVLYPSSCVFWEVTLGVLCSCEWRWAPHSGCCVCMVSSAWTPGTLPGSKASTWGYFSAIWKRCLLLPFLPLCFHLLQGHMSQAGTTPAPNKGPWSAQSHQLGAGAMQDPGSLCETPQLCRWVSTASEEGMQRFNLPQQSICTSALELVGVEGAAETTSSPSPPSTPPDPKCLCSCCWLQCGVFQRESHLCDHSTGGKLPSLLLLTALQLRNANWAMDGR